MRQGLKIRVWNQTRDTSLAECATVADDSRSRRTGLLKHERLEPGEGLWIAPCEAVHTFGMKFPIDVLFLDRKKRVRKIRAAMPPWRIAACFFARSVLELPAGVSAASHTQPGDQLRFEPCDGAPK